MKFKDLKSGFPLFILDKATLTFSTEKVNSVSLPHLDNKLTTSGLVVDVTTDHGTYCMVADSEVAYPYNKVISTDRLCILREVEAIKATAEQLLSQIDNNKETVSKCTDLIAILDPVQKEKQQTEQRFKTLENSMSEVKGSMSDIKKLLEKLTS